MTKKNRFAKRLLSILLCLALLMSYLPMMARAALSDSSEFTRIADPSTMDDWKLYFGPDVTSTQNAGGVWVDKSVFTDSSAFPGAVSMTDPDSNFLVALSAIASNKEIVGYSTIPTDTMLVLDVSGSMENDADELVASANEAIHTLLATNNNNRVGVVLYSGNSNTGSSTYAQGTVLLLPLDRYTPARDDVYLQLDNGDVQVHRNVRNSANQSVSAAKAVSGGTYIQAGLYEAMLEFEKADPTVGADNFQSGQSRLPILVLMSDGAPTTANHHFASINEYQVTIDNPDYNPYRPISDTNQPTITVTRTSSTIGNGQASCATDSVGFLTQLTASYVLNRIENHYGCAGEGLFYTLGLGVGEETGANVAVSVLDPENSTGAIDAFWANYLALDGVTAMQLTAPGTSTNENPGTTTVSIYKNAYATNQLYVDEYFYAANGDQLNAAFSRIVEEIIIQSRYYATHLEGGNPDFSGYIVFEDRIGEYMEVKDIKGILLGSHLYSGAMFTSKLNDHTEDGLGTIENPTELGLAFRDSVMARLGITDITEAMALIGNAYRWGQLSYTDETTFSNYIGWYARADMSYAGFWHEGVTTAPGDAVYTIKSYGFLGEASGNIQDSNMMFMTVQIRTNIETGQQTVVWKVPASLVPMVTYRITLEGTSEANATNVQMTIEEAEPIRLVFETGLRSDINELNVAQITDPRHVAADGSRVFWTNYWDNSAAEHEDHITTVAAFTPSVENERYYYTTNAVVYQRVGDRYVEVSADSALDAEGVYYHARYIFRSGISTAELYYEQISAESLARAQKDTEENVWIIPIGTVYRYLADYQGLKSANNTQSIHYFNYPYITVTNSSLEVDANLGNNGMLTVKPATGIKLSKTVDSIEPGTSTVFRFRITLKDAGGDPLTGTFNTLLAALNETTGTAGTVSTDDGIIEIDLNARQTFYLTGLPAGAVYTVEEIGNNTDYKVKSVHVNGEAVSGEIAAGTITQFVLDSVDFLNTPTSEGNLLITKEVVHPFGPDFVIPDSIAFEITVKLENGGEPLADHTLELVTDSGTTAVTTDAAGQLKLTIRPDETISIHGIPEETVYTVTETEIADDGFTLDEEVSSGLTGEIIADGNAQAILVNDYVPNEVSPEPNEILVQITKEFTGREWMAGDSFEFVIERLHPETGEPAEVVATVTISSPDQLTKVFDLTDEVYSHVGTYHYRICEKIGAAGNGITYDTVYRRFHVTVTDADMDGYLEITGVENVMNTTVTRDSQGNYTVAASFRNSYAPYAGTTVEIPVQKRIPTGNFGLNGFKFALYDETGTNLIQESSLTNMQGAASIRIAYAAAEIGVHKYILKEINTGINGMTYSEAIYYVTVTVRDNGDGTIGAAYTITDADGAVVTGAPVFENHYVPEMGILIISGDKELTGRVHNEGEFEFNLYQTDGTFAIDGLVPLKTYNAADGSFIFDQIEFDAPGTYYFVVTETEGTLGGMTYDKTVYQITVTVVDNNGRLEVTTDLTDNITFRNVYDPEDTEVTLEGSKILTGRDLTDGEFTFVLKDEDGKEIDTAVNAGAGFAFDAISFDQAGVYRFTVTERVGSLDGITYDTSVYDVTVTVTDDGAGGLHAAVSYAKNGLAATGLVFRNSYSPAPYEIVISGIKNLVGRELLAGEFEFVLVGALSGTELDRVKNAADGTFTFEGLPVHAAGTYHLTVTEADNMIDGVSYDTSLFDVIITIADDGKGNLTETSRVITRNGAEATDITFTNVFTPAAAEIEFTVNKVLENKSTAEMGLDGFEFRLVGEGVDLTAVSDAEGRAVFNLAYTAEDIGKTFTYTLTEIDTGIAGMLYSNKEVQITVTVTADAAGLLVTQITQDGAAAEAVVAEFVNIYAPGDTGIPETGDISGLWMWFALMFVSGGGLIANAVYGRKLKENEA